jgi:hypothetical protein
MCIQKALQLSYASREFGAGYFDRPLGSDQILGGHLVPALRREQSALKGQQAPEFRGDFSAELFPSAFARLARQCVRFVSWLVR